MPDEFFHDYDIDNLVKVRIWGFDFYVTERFIGHYTYRLYEPVSSRVSMWMQQVTNPKSLMIDAGAHYGYYSLLWAFRDKKRRIIAVEPIAENVNVLKHNIAWNRFKQIVVIAKAVSDTTRRKIIRRSVASDSSSFAPHPTGKTLEKLAVHTCRIDDVAHSSPVGGLKIDVEGHELSALRGASKIINRDQPLILFEYHPISQRLAGHSDGEVLQFLLANDYSLWAIDEDNMGVVKLQNKALLAHTQALTVFGHEGYGNILAVSNNSKHKIIKTFVHYQGRDFIPVNTFCSWPIPGAHTVAETDELTLLSGSEDFKHSGIGIVMEGKSSRKFPLFHNVDFLWLKHERDYYKNEAERLEWEVKQFKQKWIYTWGQRLKQVVHKLWGKV